MASKKAAVLRVHSLGLNDALIDRFECRSVTVGRPRNEGSCDLMRLSPLTLFQGLRGAHLEALLAASDGDSMGMRLGLVTAQRIAAALTARLHKGPTQIVWCRRLPSELVGMQNDKPWEFRGGIDSAEGIEAGREGGDS